METQLNKLRLALLGAALTSACAAPASAQAQAYMGETITVAFSFCPAGWAEMNGQELSIGSNSALFALLGTTYGGNGSTTFALPNAQPQFAANGVALRQCIATNGVFPSD
jgi:microcystin-dependent protein